MNIYQYYQAGFPFICIKTTEFSRVTQLILDQYITLKEKAVWDYEKGFTIYTDSGKEKRDTVGASQVMEDIDTFKNQSEGGSVSILRNFDNFIEKEYTGYFELREKIINRKQNWKTIDPETKVNPFKQVIFLCEERPENLPEDIPVLEFPLLKEAEIIEIMGERFKYLKQEITPQLAKLAVGMSEIEIENAFALGLAQSKKVENGIKVIDPDIISRYKIAKIKKFYTVVEPEPEGNISGLDLAIKHIKLVKKAFTTEGQKYGLEYPKIILTVGPYGTGKTLLGKVIASVLGLPALDLDLGILFEFLLGKSEENIREAWKIASAMAPVLIILDEIEKGMSGMGSKSTNSTDSTGDRMFATILKYVAEKTSAVSIYATCNDITKIPTVLLRRGRTDVIFFVGMPTFDERFGIVNIHLKKRGLNPINFDARKIAERTSGFVGGELENCIKLAMFDCCPKELTTEAILNRCDAEKILSKTKKGKADIEYIRKWAQDMAIPASSGEKGVGSGSRYVDPSLN